MPYCVRCEAWYPTRIAACERCGGAISAEDPAPDTRGPEEHLEDVWRAAGAIAILPDREAERLQPRDVRALHSAFDAVRDRAKGRHAAPVSWLPASPGRVATALDLALEDAEGSGDLQAIRHVREDIVDLQAFLPDDEAAAAEAFGVGSDRPTSPTSGDGAAALDRVRWAQAIVISMLRDDERVVGAHVALRDMKGDILIGEAAHSLETVDRYKEAQASGFAAFVAWPAGLVAGLIVGTIVAGFSVVAVVAVVGLAIAGYVLFIAPAFGIAVGTIGSRLDRAAMRSNSRTVVATGRTAATAVWFVLLYGGPAVIGFVLTVGCRWLGLP